MSADGNSLGPRFQVQPDAAEMVRRCLLEAGDNTFLEGYAIFDVTIPLPMTAKLQRAVDLPEPLLACIQAGLEASSPGPVLYDYVTAVAYVSIGVE
jgi:hypothetical protein